MRVKGYISALFVAVVVCAAAMTSCVKETEVTGEEMERRSLEAWMKKNKPELVANLQENGEYYIEVLSWGEENLPADGDIDFGSDPIMEKDSCWMFYNMTTRDLDGNVILTRNEMMARMQGSFTLNTHYVPYLNYCGEKNALALLECSYLVTRNEITLGDGRTLKLRKGSKVRLYSPSSIAYGSSGTTQEGGYEGQYILDANVPAIIDIEVMHTLKNPSELELDMISELTKRSDSAAGSTIWTQAEVYEDDSDDDGESDSSNSETEEKELEGLYYNLKYDPSNAATALEHMLPHDRSKGYVDAGKYAPSFDLDKKIADKLVERFGEDVVAESKLSDETLVGKGNTANVWYIGRFLDGFIFDTNIPEIRELVFNEKDATGSALSYTADSDKDNYISAWYYTIPRMHYGRWAALVTTSAYAYGANGQSGSTKSSGNQGNIAYGADFYYDYYYGYNSIYYSDYYNYNTYIPTAGGTTSGSTDSEDTETETTQTEIMPYTPIMFYVFIEPKSES